MSAAMGTPNKVTPEIQSELLRRWHDGESHTEIAKALSLNRATVSYSLRKLLSVETPEWRGNGRIALQRPLKLRELPRPVVYPENPARLAFPLELVSGESARFWSKVAAPNENGCRLWLASRKSDGSGQFDYDIAYRVSWRLVYGPIPEGMNINHRCDIRPCVEPTHLWLGTQAENLADMAAKGRWNLNGDRRGQPGEDNATAKLTWEIVREMRAVRSEKGLTYKQLSKRFRISVAQVSNIITGKQWVE